MRNLIATAALVTSLALGSTAFAAATASTTPAKTMSAAKSKAASTAQHAKMSDCAKSWKAQTSHTGTRQAYMKSCLAKG